MNYPKQQLIAGVVLTLMSLYSLFFVIQSFYLELSSPGYYMFGLLVPIVMFITNVLPVVAVAVVTFIRAYATVMISFVAQLSLIILLLYGLITQYVSYAKLGNSANWDQFYDSSLTIVVSLGLLILNVILLGYVLFVSKAYENAST